jgi:Mrp family chromosome partitioning ATPase
MTGEWQASIERILAPAIMADTRVLGFLAIHRQEGVSALALAAAEAFRRRGANVLYLDLASPRGPDTRSQRGGATLQHWREVERADLVQVEAAVSSNNRGLFDSIPWLRNELTTKFKSYSNIIVDLPPLNEQAPSGLNPISGAAACDAVALVCVRGRTTQREAADAARLLAAARINLIGTVLNDRDYTPEADEIAAFAGRVLRPTGRFGRWVSSTIARADILR